MRKVESLNVKCGKVERSKIEKWKGGKVKTIKYEKVEGMKF